MTQSIVRGSDGAAVYEDDQPKNKLGYNIIIDLSRLGYNFYEALFEFFVGSRGGSKEFEWCVNELYYLCLGDFIRAISPSKSETIERLSVFPDANGLHQVTMAIPPEVHDQLIQICHEHAIGIYIHVYSQIERHHAASDFRTICYIPASIQMDLLIMTEVYPYDDAPIPPPEGPMGLDNSV